jgi:hypothetical protein
MQPKPKPQPNSARTELRRAIAALEATRARIFPYAALQAWRDAATRSRQRRSERPKPH